MFLYSLPGPVGSVSSIMDTTWAVISWSVPSYIPLNYLNIRYEIGYHVLDNCSMADVDDINIQVTNHSNVSSNNTYINITGLSDKTCYIFGVRAGTINGYGEWTVIANETLQLPLVTFFTETITGKTINIIAFCHVVISIVSAFLTTVLLPTLSTIIQSVTFTTEGQCPYMLLSLFSLACSYFMSYYN